MDHIILGLLLLQDRTIYQLRDRINKGLHLMYSSSMGSIQAAIKKLLGNGYISFHEVVENGKHKKIYSLTDDGKAHFLEWINAPIESQNIKNPELAKIYFFGFSAPENRAGLLEKYLNHLRDQYHALSMICEDADKMTAPKECQSILFYQIAAARYGKDLMKFQIEWYENLLRDITGAGPAK